MESARGLRRRREQVPGAAVMSDSPSPEFLLAVQRHQACLAEFGEDDPRTVEAAHRCMLLMPEPMFRELMEIGEAPRH